MLLRIFWLLASYAVAAALSSHISLDLRATDWGNAMTYVWWFGAAWVLYASGMVIAVVIAAAKLVRMSGK